MVTEIANNGEEGIRCVQELSLLPLYLVLMNVLRPGMNGYAATKVIRRFKGLPIVAITTNAMESDKVFCFAASMAANLTKSMATTMFFAPWRRC